MTASAIPAASGSTLTADDRDAIVDALYRFGAGQDLRDRALFESAFTADATLDFTGPARRLGASIPVFEGRQGIADTIFANIAHLDTTHTVSNPRIRVDEDGRVELSALVAAQHLPRDDHSRHLLLTNFYFASMAREGGTWRIRDVRIETVWMDGEPAVLFAAS